MLGRAQRLREWWGLEDHVFEPCVRAWSATGLNSSSNQTLRRLCTLAACRKAGDVVQKSELLFFFKKKKKPATQHEFI